MCKQHSYLREKLKQPFIHHSAYRIEPIPATIVLEAGYILDRSPFCHKAHTETFTSFGLWEEAGVPKENPGENKETPHRKAPASWWIRILGLSCG